MTQVQKIPLPTWRYQILVNPVQGGLPGFLFLRPCDPVPRNAPARDDYHQKIKRSLLKPNISKHDL